MGCSHTNTHNIFRLVHPVYDMDMHIFKVTVFIKQAINMNRIPDFMLRSVFSTCSSRGSSLGGGGGGGGR